MEKYPNFNSNSLISSNNGPTGGLSRFMKAGGGLSTNVYLIIGCIILFGVIAFLYYIFYISPSLNTKYTANSEQVPTGSSKSSNTAELLFFYADWCPHCTNKTETKLYELDHNCTKVIDKYGIFNVIEKNILTAVFELTEKSRVF